MPTHVYANNNEVASKAADGKSIAAFPDVCFSPPAPPVGPMPLPYPNTGEVKDTDSGTAKVFIKDKMSGMAGDSHMTKSMGDEAATQNFNKGMITGALQGKCYFGLWSMDVQMEGKGVPRHLDMVTHNHGCPNDNGAGSPAIISTTPKGNIQSHDTSSKEKEKQNLTVKMVAINSVLNEKVEYNITCISNGRNMSFEVKGLTDSYKYNISISINGIPRDQNETVRENATRSIKSVSAIYSNVNDGFCTQIVNFEYMLKCEFSNKDEITIYFPITPLNTSEVTPFSQYTQEAWRSYTDPMQSKTNYSNELWPSIPQTPKTSDGQPKTQISISSKQTVKKNRLVEMILGLPPKFIKEKIQGKGYKFYDSRANVFGVRSAGRLNNVFDDAVGIINAKDREYCVVAYSGTTDPGKSEGEENLGLANLVPGQHVFFIGTHKLNYPKKRTPALVGQANLKVRRDSDKLNDFIDSLGAEVGASGINIHPAWYSFYASDPNKRDYLAAKVGGWSTGCTVIRNRFDFELFFSKCKELNGKLKCNKACIDKSNPIAAQNCKHREDTEATTPPNQNNPPCITYYSLFTEDDFFKEYYATIYTQQHKIEK